MTNETMSAALFQAAQQIEGESYSSRSDDDAQQSNDVHGRIPIAPAQTVSPSTVTTVPLPSFAPKTNKETNSRSRAIRLEQNRKAARESRRRKKAMVEELQRSLMFFSKSNAVLKQQNEILARQIFEAHQILADLGKPLPTVDGNLLQSSPVPPAGVECSPQNVENRTTTYDNVVITSMQPGATMQAMASFQQAAQAAMEAASRTMQAHGVVVHTEESNDNSHDV